MAVLDIRQRTGYLFLAVVLGHVILISTQVTSRAGVPVFESVIFGVIAEVQRVVMSATSGVRRVWTGYIGLRHVKTENDDLKRQLAEAQVLLQQQRALADRARGFQDLLELRDRANLQTVAAEIIGAASASDFLTITIDKGSRAGLKPDMAVIAPAGIVGRIIVTSPRSSKVQLLVDRNAAAGAIIERSRAQGVAMGGGGGDGRLRLEYMSEAFDVAVGDEVVTSGIDMIYPKGFAIGKVDVVEKAGAAYKRVTIKPAVDFSSIEEVLVVLTPPPGREPAEPGPKGSGGHE
jgi:rod shape-determining protein MreC